VERECPPAGSGMNALEKMKKMKVRRREAGKGKLTTIAKT
jgi:hypothetical protein